MSHRAQSRCKIPKKKGRNFGDQSKPTREHRKLRIMTEFTFHFLQIPSGSNRYSFCAVLKGHLFQPPFCIPLFLRCCRVLRRPDGIYSCCILKRPYYLVTTPNTLQEYVPLPNVRKGSLHRTVGSFPKNTLYRYLRKNHSP